MFRVWDIRRKCWYRGSNGWVKEGKVYKNETGARSSVGGTYATPHLAHLKPADMDWDSIRKLPDAERNKIREAYWAKRDAWCDARQAWYKENKHRPFNELWEGVMELVPYGEKPKHESYTED